MGDFYSALGIMLFWACVAGAIQEIVIAAVRRLMFGWQADTPE